MQILIISLDHSCNNHCRFCSQADLAPPSAPPDIRARLEKARGEGANVVHFVGGEPTLHDALPSWIAAAKHLGFERIGLQTNGRRLAYPSYARTLAAEGLGPVDIALQGATGALHDYHTNAPGSFKQTISGLKRAHEASLEVAVTTVITRSNMRHLPDLGAAMGVLKVANWRMRMSLLVGRAREDGSRLVPRWSMVEPYVRRALDETAKNACTAVVSGLPLCIDPSLPRYDPASDEAPQGVYGHACEDCAARAACAGFDAGYLTLYGERDLRPMKEGRPEMRGGPDFSDPLKLPFVGGLGRTVADQPVPSD